MTQIGSIIDGKYRVIDQIGEGGMSVVWLVTDSRLNKQWAIKEIKKNARTETHKVIVDSLRAEANLMKGLDHPALPRIVDIIEDGDSLYVVMDFIQGDDLLSVLKSHRRVITEADVVDWGIQLCDALSYLHSKGIVYRDMKPGNVMLMNDGTVKIIDFGIAREYSPDKEDDTMPLGTRGYASPEAFKRGVQTTPVSDIYSLGVTLFHLVTGHGPMEYVDQPTLPPIRMINPALSEGLEYVIIKATQWAPADRYQSCMEMRYDLENLGKLTKDHRRKLERTMRLFKVSAIAGVVCLVLGVGFLIAGNIVRNNSYDELLVRAKSANTTETQHVAADGRIEADPSEAEQLYTQAIDIIDNRILPYDRLINDVYLADSVFCQHESKNWIQLHNTNQSRIEGITGSDAEDDPGYTKLCYDAALAYFLYFENDENENSETSDAQRFATALPWLKRAQVSNETTNALEPSQQTTIDTYIYIAEFADLLGRRVEAGEELEAYRQYWENLEAIVDSVRIDTNYPTIVQLRLCNMAFTAINGPTFLPYFQNAGIPESDVKALLQRVRDRAVELQSVASTSQTASNYCDNIISNYDAAFENVNSVYGNVGAKAANYTSTSTSSSSQSGSSASSGSSAASGSSASSAASSASSASSTGRGAA